MLINHAKNRLLPKAVLVKRGRRTRAEFSMHWEEVMTAAAVSELAWKAGRLLMGRLAQRPTRRR